MSEARGLESEGVAGSETERRSVRLVIFALSAAVCLLVALVLYGVPAQSAARGPSTLSSVNAILNGMASAFLVGGFFCIRAKKIRAHRVCMVAAFALSCVFLVGYLLHHAEVGSVPYTGEGISRVIYFSLLIPHIILAAIVLPLALFTIYRGQTGRFQKHRKIARVTLPIWLYVSVSGVILYFMLYHA